MKEPRITRKLVEKILGGLSSGDSAQEVAEVLGIPITWVRAVNKASKMQARRNPPGYKFKSNRPGFCAASRCQFGGKIKSGDDITVVQDKTATQPMLVAHPVCYNAIVAGRDMVKSAGPATAPVAPSGPIPSCPNCKIPMSLKSGAKGNFWGCPNFPAAKGGCRFTLDPTKVTAHIASMAAPKGNKDFGPDHIKGRPPSPYQKSIRDAFENTTSHLIVDAKAGSGKTTTLEWILHTATKPGKVLFLAFNVSIADELAKRLPAYVKTRTLNGYGNSLLAERLPEGVEMLLDKQKVKKIISRFWPHDKQAIERDPRAKLYKAMANPLAKLIGLIKGTLNTDSRFLQQRYGLNFAEAAEIIDQIHDEYVPRILAEDRRMFEEPAQPSPQEIAEMQKRAIKKGKEFVPPDALVIIDFDDQIWLPSPGILNITPRYTYDTVFVDEAQDLNTAQRLLALKAAGKGRVVAVGDPYQCWVSNTLISTPEGNKTIDTITPGMMVTSPFGMGKIGSEEVLEVHKRKYQGPVVKLTLENGQEVTGTPAHVMFAQRYEFPWSVYVMYKKGVGYRIGVTKKSDQRKEGSGSHHRMIAETADKMWILHSCNTRREAQKWEHYYSIKYGVPTWVFTDRQGGGESYNQEDINWLFKELNTEKSFEKLAEDFGLMKEYPHYQPNASAGEVTRYKLNLRFFGDTRSKNSVSGLHRISINSSDVSLFNTMQDLKVRKGKAKTFRYEASNKNYHKLFIQAKEIEKLGASIEETANLLADRSVQFGVNIGSILPGWSIIIRDKNELKAVKVVNKTWDFYDGYVHDLSIKNTACYFANDAVSHNSIYGFRGADTESMSNFYSTLGASNRGCLKLPLSISYRCPKPVIDYARNVLEMLGPITDNIEASPNAIDNAGCQQLYNKGCIINADADWISMIKPMDALPTAPDPVTGKGGGETKVMILSRINSALVTPCFELMAQGIKATIRGRDVSRDLIALIDDVNPQYNTNLPKFLTALEEYEEKVEEEMLAAKRSPRLIKDSIKAIVAVAARANNIQDLKDIINRMFSDKICPKCAKEVESDDGICRDCKVKSIKTDGITLSSVHKAKGLEAHRVFILVPELLGSPPWAEEEWEKEQERNLYYVAVTRAMKQLIFVTGEGEHEDEYEQAELTDEEEAARLAFEKKRLEQEKIAANLAFKERLKQESLVQPIPAPMSKEEKIISQEYVEKVKEEPKAPPTENFKSKINFEDFLED